MQMPHELVQEFPGMAERIHELRENDAHFRKLADRYHDLNKAVYRAQERLDVVTEDEEHKLRHERLKLKDEIARLLG